MMLAKKEKQSKEQIDVTVIISMEGGVVQSAFCHDPNVTLKEIIIDWDDEDNGVEGHQDLIASLEAAYQDELRFTDDSLMHPKLVKCRETLAALEALERANTIKDYRHDEKPNEVRTLVKSLCWHSTSDIETCISILNSHVCTSREDYTEVFNSWSIEDVKLLRNDLTDDQCRDVLDSVILNHDAGEGINWHVIEIVIDELFPQSTDS